MPNFRRIQERIAPPTDVELPMEGIQLDIFTAFTPEELAQEEGLCRSPMGRGRDPRVRALFCERDELVRLGSEESLSTLVLDYLEERTPAFRVRGSRVASPTDAAALFAALRSPYVERLSWMITDQERVQGSGVHTIGTHCGTDCPLDPADWRDFLIAGEGCERPRLYIAHNHPSGNPEPSDADRRIYIEYAHRARLLGMEFTGLVLNGHRYAEIHEGGGHTFAPYPLELPRPYEAIPAETITWQCSKPEHVAAFIKRIQTPAETWIGLFLDPQKCVRSVQTYADTPHGVRLIHDLARFSADRVIIVRTAKTDCPPPPIRSWPKEVLDVITVTETGWTSAEFDGTLRHLGWDLK